MSCPMTKAERSKAKDSRQGKEPDRPLRCHSSVKKARPFKLWRRTKFILSRGWSEWHVAGRYHSEAARQQALSSGLISRMAGRVEYHCGDEKPRDARELPEARRRA